MDTTPIVKTIQNNGKLYFAYFCLYHPKFVSISFFLFPESFYIPNMILCALSELLRFLYFNEILVGINKIAYRTDIHRTLNRLYKTK